MILDLVYTNKNLYTSNLIKSRPMYLLGLGITSLYTRDFYYLVNTLTSTESIHWDCSIDKANVYTNKKF